MKVYRTLVALAACFAISQTFAQSKINLSGTIIEKETNEPVMAASVRVMLLPEAQWFMEYTPIRWAFSAWWTLRNPSTENVFR